MPKSTQKISNMGVEANLLFPPTQSLEQCLACFVGY